MCEEDRTSYVKAAQSTGGYLLFDNIPDRSYVGLYGCLLRTNRIRELYSVQLVFKLSVCQIMEVGAEYFKYIGWEEGRRVVLWRDSPSLIHLSM